MNNVGDYTPGATVLIPVNTNAADGASITIGVNGTLKIYKNASTTERTSLAGVTLYEDFDGHTGQHLVAIDTSDNTDAGFYAAGNDYFLAFTGAEIDDQPVNAIIGQFSIQNRSTAALKTILDKLNTMLEADDANFRFTEAALVNSPAGGGGGDATEAKQDTILAAIATLDGKADSILEDTSTTLPGTLVTIASYIDTEISAIINALGTVVDLGSGATIAHNLADIAAQGSASIAWGELSVKSTAGSMAQVTAWLERAGQRFAISSSNPTVFTAATNDVCTSAGHGLEDGDVLLLTTSNTLPAGLSSDTPYYVRDKTTDTFKLAATAGGAAIDITDTGTGTHNWHKPEATVTVREHGAGSNLFVKSLTAADLTNDIFEAEQSSPNFTDDRQYEVTVNITDGDVDITTTHIRTVIG